MPGVFTGLPSELDNEAALARRDRHILVETLRQRRAHLDLRAAYRIRIGEKLAGFEVVQNIAHHCSTEIGRLGERLTSINPAAISPNATKIVTPSGSPSRRRPEEHAEHRRQEGETRQAGGRIALYQPEPEHVGDGDDIDRLED